MQYKDEMAARRTYLFVNTEKLIRSLEEMSKQVIEASEHPAEYLLERRSAFRSTKLEWMDISRFNRMLNASWKHDKGLKPKTLPDRSVKGLIPIGEAFYDLSYLIKGPAGAGIKKLVDETFPWLMDETCIRIPLFMATCSGDRIMIHCDKHTVDKCFDALVGIALRIRMGMPVGAIDYYITDAVRFEEEFLFNSFSNTLLKDMNRKGLAAFSKMIFGRMDVMNWEVLLSGPYHELNPVEESFILERFQDSQQILLRGSQYQSVDESQYDIILSCQQGYRDYTLALSGLPYDGTLSPNWHVRLYRKPGSDVVQSIHRQMVYGL